MAATGDSKPDYEQIAKDALLERKAIEALKDLNDAKKALEVSQSSPDPAKKAKEEQLKSATDSKALAEASLEAFKAQVGTITASGFTDSVELKPGAGVIEATILSAKAIKLVSEKITQIIGEHNLKNKTVLLHTSTDAPNFQSLIAFRTQSALVKRALSQAMAESEAVKEQKPASPTDTQRESSPDGQKMESVPPIAAAGFVLEAISKAVSYFRSDYAAIGTEVSVEDSMLVRALAQTILGKSSSTKLKIPSIYDPQALMSSLLLADQGTGIGAEINTMANIVGLLQNKSIEHEKVGNSYLAAMETAADEQKKELADKAQKQKAAVNVIRAAVDIYNTFFAKLFTPDEKGMLLLAGIIKEEVLASALQKDELLLLVKVHKAGGSHYTKKSFTTFWGGMPFYHSGGAVGSFVLLSGKQGEILASGVVPAISDFIKADELIQHVK